MEFSITTWKCWRCDVVRIDPSNLEELLKKCPNCGAEPEGK